jgi:hypothetical protein
MYGCAILREAVRKHGFSKQRQPRSEVNVSKIDSTRAVVESQTEVEYRDIPGFPGYRVGSDGTVWTCWQQVRTNWCRGWVFKLSTSWKMMRPARLKSGYLGIGVRLSPGTKVQTTVHRLVLLAFVGPCPPGRETRHLNGNKKDNRPDNLAWGTPQENARDRVGHGTAHRARGMLSCRAKLKDGDIIEIRRRRLLGETCASLAMDYGISTTTISNIAWRKTWAHI